MQIDGKGSEPDNLQLGIGRGGSRDEENKVPCGKRDLHQGGVFGNGKREVLGLHGTEGGQKGYDGKNN